MWCAEQDRESDQMRVFILTLHNQIYTTIVLRELVAAKHDIVGIGSSTAFRPGKSLLPRAKKTIAYSGFRYFFLRLLEQFHNQYLQLKSPYFCSVSKFARLNSIPIYFTVNVNAPSFIRTVALLQPDIVISLYFDQIIRRELITLPRYGCINVHRALLPKYRGPNSAFWQLAQAEKRSGLTIHYVDEGTDTGDIISQQDYEITPEETHHSLCLKSAQVCTKLLPGVLKEIENGRPLRMPQLDSEATSFPFPTREATKAFLKQGRRMF